MEHHYALLAGYASALAGWTLATRLLPSLWPRREPPTFARPWHEIGFALIAVAGVLGVGQLYVRGWLLPAVEGRSGVALDAVNQVVIFAPLFLLLLVRRQPLETAWLPGDRIWARVGIGLLLALLAVLVFSVTRSGSRSWLELLPDVYHPRNLSHLVQVLCEDVAIAILFVRFRAALGTASTIGIVAGLFALGHVPALLAGGATLDECARLVLDAGLAVLVLCVLQRSADVWWFWCVHFAMDMMQFHAVSAEIGAPG